MERINLIHQGTAEILKVGRKDIILIRLNGIFKPKHIEEMQKYYKKLLHRKVIVIDEMVKDVKIICK